MKLFLKILVLVLILIVFGGTLIFLYNKSREKPVIFETRSPFITNLVKKTVATGSIVPRKEIEIKPQISGILEEIYVESGDRVKKGALIARIRVIPNMISLNNAETRLKLARINLDDTKRELDRQYKLFEKKIISAAKYQEYEMAYNSAKEEMDAADNNLQLIKAGVTKKPGEETNTLIRSTIDGMILDIPVKEGKSVIETNNFNAGTTIAIIADMMEMIFEGKVDESEVGKIKTGMDLILSVGAIEKEKFDAILEYISDSSTLPLKIISIISAMIAMVVPALKLFVSMTDLPSLKGISKIIPSMVDRISVLVSSPGFFVTPALINCKLLSAASISSLALLNAISYS